MKTILVLDAFPPSLKETVASVAVVWHICITNAQKVLRVFFFFFAAVHKDLNTICRWNWLHFISSVGLHCVSLLTHGLPQSEAPPSALKSFLFFSQGFYLIATPPPPSAWLRPPFHCWLPGDLLKLWCRERDRQLHKPKPYWLIPAEPKPVEDTAFPLHNWCSQPLLQQSTCGHWMNHYGNIWICEIGTWKIGCRRFRTPFWAKMPLGWSQPVSACVRFHQGEAAGYVTFKHTVPKSFQTLMQEHLRASREGNKM